MPRDIDLTLVRAARTEDIADVLALWASARSPAATTPDDADGIARLISHDGGALIVAEDDGRLVGALVAAWDGWRGNMYRLAVLPDYRRRGVARRLVELGHEHLRAKGAKRVTALVAQDEDDAMGLWLAVGYSRDEQLSRYVTNL